MLAKVKMQYITWSVQKQVEPACFLFVCSKCLYCFHQT